MKIFIKTFLGKFWLNYLLFLRSSNAIRYFIFPSIFLEFSYLLYVLLTTSASIITNNYIIFGVLFIVHFVLGILWIYFSLKIESPSKKDIDLPINSDELLETISYLGTEMPFSILWVIYHGLFSLIGSLEYLFKLEFDYLLALLVLVNAFFGFSWLLDLFIILFTTKRVEIMLNKERKIILNRFTEKYYDDLYSKRDEFSYRISLPDLFSFSPLTITDIEQCIQAEYSDGSVYIENDNIILTNSNRRVLKKMKPIFVDLLVEKEFELRKPIIISEFEKKSLMN